MITAGKSYEAVVTIPPLTTYTSAEEEKPVSLVQVDYEPVWKVTTL